MVGDEGLIEFTLTIGVFLLEVYVEAFTKFLPAVDRRFVNGLLPRLELKLVRAGLFLRKIRANLLAFVEAVLDAGLVGWPHGFFDELVLFNHKSAGNGGVQGLVLARGWRSRVHV